MTTVCDFMQESALRSRHIIIVKKGWLSKGPDSNPDANIVSFSRVSVRCFDHVTIFLLYNALLSLLSLIMIGLWLTSHWHELEIR